MLSKILPLVFLPLGLCLLLFLFAFIFRNRWAFVSSFLILFFFSLGLVSQSLWYLLEAPWRRHTAIEAPIADAIVVLSGGLHPAPGSSRLSEWHDPDRFFAGLELFRAGKAPRLLFTGGTSPFLVQQPEGHFYLQKAARLGVPFSAMASTRPVVNTAEEASAIRHLLPPGPSRVLLVTSAFHMRRAQRLFERQGIDVHPFPVDFQARGKWAGPLSLDPTQWIPTAKSLSHSSRALRELCGRLIYWAW